MVCTIARFQTIDSRGCQFKSAWSDSLVCCNLEYNKARVIDHLDNYNVPWDEVSTEIVSHQRAPTHAVAGCNTQDRLAGPSSVSTCRQPNRLQKPVAHQSVSTCSTIKDVIDPANVNRDHENQHVRSRPERTPRIHIPSSTRSAPELPRHVHVNTERTRKRPFL